MIFLWKPVLFQRYNFAAHKSMNTLISLQINNKFSELIVNFIDTTAAPQLEVFLLKAIENQRPSIIFKSISLVVTIYVSFDMIPRSLETILEDRLPSLIHRASFEDCHKLSGFQELKEVLSKANFNKRQSKAVWKGIEEVKRILTR